MRKNVVYSLRPFAGSTNERLNTMAIYGGLSENQLEKELLESILSEAVTGVALVSPHPDGVKLEYTNEAFFTIFGYTREEYEFLDDETRLGLFNYSDFTKIIDRINTDYAVGEILRFECRVNKKGGEQGWALITTRKLNPEKFGEQRFVCNMSDITDMKKLQIEIEEEKKRYELVEEMSDDIIFTYDVIKDEFSCSPKILRSLRKYTFVNNAMERIIYGDVFDHRDIFRLIEAMNNGLSGKRINSFDARIINLLGDGIWHRIKFATVYDKEENAVRFVGTIRNIERERKEKNRLVSQSQTDQLTGFLTKMSTSMKINEMIRNNDLSDAAMFLVDIDDFKHLNDTYGHVAGDNFLRDFTKNLSLTFHSDDVLGRVGGEEFIVFSSGKGASKKLAKEKAVEIENICKNVVIESAPGKNLSCSIGIARYPKDGDSYGEMFEKADNAMFSVKKNGKNGFAFAGEDNKIKKY